MADHKAMYLAAMDAMEQAVQLLAEAQQKCDVFYAVGRITDEQYTELCALIESVYAE